MREGNSDQNILYEDKIHFKLKKKINMVLAKNNQTYRVMKQTDKDTSQFLTHAKTYIEGMMVSLTNGVGDTGYPYIEK